GMAELPSASPAVRAALESKAAEKGWPYLHERLTKIDPAAAARIKPSDRQRLQRALEVFELTGRKLSDLQAESHSNPTLDTVEVAIEPPDRTELHGRIAARFDQMLEDGLVPEVETLRESFDLNPTLPAMKSVGYRQVWEYLEGEIDWAEMRLRGIIATRQLAKRQLTWLRGWSHLHRLPSPNLDALLKIKALAHIFG
ncbi:MAG: tRNA (adenosine(37)-N6)-dimethylallyltransferase MiaA, partial [Pseudomonadota bacterium]|nr:tRNA (adenosine(37)-N6)-dimethylallyltransferase MiaA [Pseudomonadota bacterium]